MCYTKKYGTYDLYGKNSFRWKNIIDNITNTCSIYNFNYIKTPMFESTDLFANMIGSSTDVISKELYNFFDKDNDNISLRPEGTTGVIRSYIENKLYLNNNISKFYYYGSMFRDENVENGRYREFQQFGVEVFNNNSFVSDIEVISLAINIFRNLGLDDVTVYINNLGSKEDKNKYEGVIKEYFTPYLDVLCDDCKKRFLDNPIRILDCKVDKRKDFVINAPKIDDYINNESKIRFNKILESLDNLNIKYIVNKNLVRGLNYYTDTVFEIKTNIDNYGTANTICGGGRYNNTVITDDNLCIPAIGFAIGLERLFNILEKKGLFFDTDKLIDFNVMFEDINLINILRNNGYISDFNSNDNSKYTIKKNNNEYVLLDNINNNKYTLNYEDLLKKIVNNNY